MGRALRICWIINRDEKKSEAQVSCTAPVMLRVKSAESTECLARKVTLNLLNRSAPRSTTHSQIQYESGISHSSSPESRRRHVCVLEMILYTLQ